MAQLGIDFGTTHTVVALSDRGNYPVVAFEEGNAFPSLIAARDFDGALCYGTEAAAVAHEEGWSCLRSFKRLLSGAGPQTEIVLGGRLYPLTDLLAGFLSHLKETLLHRSNAGLRPRDTLEVAVSVPANALGAQRFLTIDAFQRAGFTVSRVLNEPSAAAFEYADRFNRTLTSNREYIIVYDLGGGTFDASLLHMSGLVNEVVATAGVSHLGGDDFDEAILSLVIDRASLSGVSGRALSTLLEECRNRKEAVSPATKRFIVDLQAVGHPPLTLPIEEVYEACHPLVIRTLEALRPLTEEFESRRSGGVSWDEIAGIYTVGGASDFPPVYRSLRDLFGQNRVRRSAHPFSATAIGLATALDRGTGYEITECVSRHFGVWREKDDGRGVVFDVIFRKNTPLPGSDDPPLEATRRYRAAHNIGHYRFIECSGLQDGNPAGDLLPWREVRFPFDPALRGAKHLSRDAVNRLDGTGPLVEERYRLTGNGLIEVSIVDLESGFTRHYRDPAHALEAR